MDTLTKAVRFVVDVLLTLTLYIGLSNAPYEVLYSFLLLLTLEWFTGLLRSRLRS